MTKLNQKTKITKTNMEFIFQRAYRGPLKAILLDWAGTTMDYGCMAPAVVFMDVFKRKGVEITIDEAREPMGAHKKVHIRQISKNENVAKRWEQKHGRKPNEALSGSRTCNSLTFWTARGRCRSTAGPPASFRA